MSVDQNSVIKLLESGHTVTSACRQAGISRKLFYDWLKSDDEFREAIMHSDLADIVTIEDVLFVKAMNGSVQDRRLFFERRASPSDLCQYDEQLELLRKLKP